MFGKHEAQPIGKHVGAVQLPIDAESLRQPRRAARQVPVHSRVVPAAPGCVQPRDDFPCPQQQPSGIARCTANHIGAVVHPVGEVHVQMTCLTEHRCVPGGLSAEGVRAGIFGAHIRLHLGDAYRDRMLAVVVRQPRAKQERRNLDSRVRKPGALECWIHQKTVSRRAAASATAMSDFR